MVSVAKRPALARVELSGLRRLEFEAVVAKVLGDALRPRLQPKVLEVGHPGRRSGDAESVEVAVALTAPVLEGDAQLEARPGGADELALVDAEQLVEGA